MRNYALCLDLDATERFYRVLGFEAERHRHGSGPVLPFTSSTGGGGALQSDNYTLELYALPTSPVRSTSSSSYVLHLGPGALRAAGLPSE